MASTITIQPGNTSDGTYDVRQPLPYPYHVNAETGDVGRQDFWKGDPARVLGFQRTADRQRIDLLWEDAAKDPQQIVGMYPVLLDTSPGRETDEGQMYNLTVPITDVATSDGWTP